MPFEEISYKDLKLNPMTLFADEWAALAAGGEGSSNAMTIAWGELGTLWERGKHTNRLPVVSVYVRPGRYTHGFMEREDAFTVSFFGQERKKALAYLGSHSGRDGDKYAPAGLTPVYEVGSVPDAASDAAYASPITYFAEAKLVLVCKKLYEAPLVESGFQSPDDVEFNYPKRDFHTMYVGEIVRVLQASAS